MKAERALLTAGIWRSKLESPEDIALTLFIFIGMGIFITKQAWKALKEKR